MTRSVRTPALRVVLITKKWYRARNSSCCAVPKNKRRFASAARREHRVAAGRIHVSNSPRVEQGSSDGGRCVEPLSGFHPFRRCKKQPSLAILFSPNLSGANQASVWVWGQEISSSCCAYAEELGRIGFFWCCARGGGIFSDTSREGARMTHRRSSTRGIKKP